MNTTRLIAAILGLYLGAAAIAQESADDTGIPPQPLNKALEQFADQSGLQIIYVAELAEGKDTSGAKPSLSDTETLDQLLASTGLQYEFLNDNTVTVHAAADDAGGDSEAGNGRTAGATPKPAMLAQMEMTQENEKWEEREQDNTRVKQGEQAIEEIVVTGTYIRNGASASPVSEIRRSQILQSGRPRLGDVLQQVPQNFSGGQNPSNIGGNNGSLNGTASSSSASIANLRGLGSDSTLTLIDGHRAAFDTISYGVDLSLIPVAAVDRVDILTDGASALYGSDAVAGVVNVILRNDYSGAETQVRSGVATRGGYSNLRLSQLVGHSWLEGNLMGAVEYYGADALSAADRSFASGAVSPTDLSPRQSDLSFFINGHQEIGDSLTLYGKGLYAKRSSQLWLTSTSSRYSDSSLNEYTFVGGVKVRVGGWNADLSGSLGQSRNRLVSTTQSNSTATPVESESRIQNGLYSFDFTAEGPVFSLPSGAIRAAIGTGHRSEGFESTGGLIPQDSDRSIRYGFAELNAPVIQHDPTRIVMRRFELNAAARYEKYSDFGSSLSPKLGFVAEILPDLDIRGTWGRSFRAPTLSELYSGAVTSLFRGSLFGVSSPPTATVLIATGSNDELGPQKARTWTAGFDFHPARIEGARLKVGYFDIDYQDRIALPITSLTQALVDPVYAPFVVYAPSADLQQSFIDQASFPLFNNAGAAYNSGNVVALLLDQYTNVSRQRAKGWDISIEYSHISPIGRLSFRTDGTWLSLAQWVLPSFPTTRIDGTLFNVPSFKGIATAAWSKDDASVSLTINHTSGQEDSTTPAHVDDITTVDLLLGLQLSGESGFLKDLNIQLAATNLLDADPPYVNPARNTFSGLAYDPGNASPFGRVVSITLTKHW